MECGFEMMILRRLCDMSWLCILPVNFFEV